MNYKEWLIGIKGYSERTVDVYTKYSFELETCKLDWKLMIKRYIEKSSSTRRLVLSSIKSYYIYLNDERSTEIHLPKREFKVSDHVSFEEYKNYLSKINRKSRMGFQKYIILRILFETGLRSSELLWITKKSIRGNKIKIHGKGGKERFVRISNWLNTELDEYTKSIKTDRLFPFSYKNLYQKIRILDKERYLTPHMFRHGYARHCFKSGISIYDISLSMGHSSMDTTAKYINKNSEDIDIYTIF